MLPNFLIIGSQKAGTTTLYNIFRRHPQIFMPEKKEVNFFYFDHLYKRGTDFYKKYFNKAESKFDAVGEASPGYICHPEAPSRIKKHLSSIKLLLTVRNPTERAYSQYWDNRRKLEETLDFSETLSVALSDDYVPGKLGYFSRGVYIRYIKRYLKYFSQKKLLILVFDDIISDPLNVYKKCFRFLNVDDSFICEEMYQKFNPSVIYKNPLYNFFFNHPKYTSHLPAILRRLLFFGHKEPFKYPPMNDEIRATLIEFFSKPNKQLSGFLNRDLSYWNK